MRKVRRIRRQGQATTVTRERLAAVPVDVQTLDAKVALIQELIPLGLLYVEEALQQEVTHLAGPRYARQGGRPGVVRYGKQPGSIYLADQKLGIETPRVRDLDRNQEIPLTTYQRLREPRRADEGVLRRILVGLSCREYARGAEAVPEAFGMSGSTISRRFRQVSARHLQALQERSLEAYDFVALVLDGKVFAEDTMVVALGITVSGDKIILGFVQTSTENGKVCTQFLRELVARGLRSEAGLLVVLDGGKGLHTAVTTVFEEAAAIQRCQWHKRENVVAYLAPAHQAALRRKLEAAYRQPTYAQAKAALLRVRAALVPLNESAVRSLDEGLEETLTLHRLGVFPELGISLRTTNCLESINALVEQRTGKVDYWKNSHQKQRWLATALLDIEPRLRRIRGYRHLRALRRALQARPEAKVKKAA
jgi:putative transposase